MEEMGTFKTTYRVGNCYPGNVNAVMREHIREKPLVGMGKKCHAVLANKIICLKEGLLSISYLDCHFK